MPRARERPAGATVAAAGLLRGAVGRDCMQRGVRNDAQKMCQVDGLYEKPVEASGLASFSIGSVTVTRKRHEKWLLTAVLRSDTRGELVAVHDWHTDVDHRDGWMELIERCKGLWAVMRHDDLMTCAFHEHRKEIQRVFIVVDEQNAPRGVHSRN